MANESEKSFPFDSANVGGVFDREYVADDFARYFRAIISSGMFMAESTNLQVIANGDMTVTLKKGDLIIEGYRYENVSDITIQLQPADGIMNRIDRIALTWSRQDRDIHFTLRQGTNSYEPVAPECRRTADYIDFVTADVYVQAGTISITQADITDQRLNSELCGIATPFTEVDTTTIFNQFESWFENLAGKGDNEVRELIETYDSWIINLKNEELDKCEELVREMQDILSGSAAGKLQIEIDELKAADTEMSSDIFLNKYGFIGKTTTFNEDGSITEVDDDLITKTTTFNEDGSITETLSREEVTLATKTTTFNEDGSITEEIEV